ncbi:uncharacterized protein LOC121430815 [Lytechinus variegatus]|uniref:uncharacterized protein LOC121430815 n=1 Tax=Lytechinus variegatus TaxID=7654 RepID=UPI001BB15B52|nr:uncharacterized protein LOC121430815 [Lytechinus variegatus]
MTKLRWEFLRFCLLMEISKLIQAEVDGVRLLGGNKPNQGRLQVRFDHGSSYQYMCAESWTVENSIVLCRQLGYPGLVRDYRTTSGLPFESTYDGDTVSNVASVRCGGSEYDLASCPNNHSIISCSIDQTVSIICHDYGYLGCFRQRPENFGYVPNSVRFNYAITDNDECIVRCRGGYDYAGISGSLCICTFRYPSVELDPSGDEQCDELCETNSLQACGNYAEYAQQPFYTFYSTRDGFCEAQSAPTSGNITQSYNRYGDVVTFRCNPGYEIVGSESLQCIRTSENTSEISWNGAPPTCEKPPQVQPTSMETTTIMTISTTPIFKGSSDPSFNLSSPGSSSTSSVGTSPEAATNTPSATSLDVKFIAILAGLIVISVCFAILITVFISCFVIRRHKRRSGDTVLELQPIQRPSPPSHPDNAPRLRAVKNDYVSDVDRGHGNDLAAANDHDTQVQHDYSSFHQQPKSAPNLNRAKKHGSTELLIHGGGDDEYACAYECVDNTGSDVNRGTKVASLTHDGASGVDLRSNDSATNNFSPTTTTDHEYTYIANAHTPPFLSERRYPDHGQDVAYEIPTESPAPHVFQEVKRPQGFNQDTSHYSNENVIHPRSRANRDMI